MKKIKKPFKSLSSPSKLSSPSSSFFSPLSSSSLISPPLSLASATTLLNNNNQENSGNSFGFDASARVQLPNIQIPDQVQVTVSTNNKKNKAIVDGDSEYYFAR